MSKSILISIKPEHALNILNGKKTLELRKSVPKDFVGWVYGYVTKGKPYLYKTPNYLISSNRQHDGMLNGTIPFRFWFDGYDIYVYDGFYLGGYFDDKVTLIHEDNYKLPLGNLCLTEEQIKDYGKGKDLYAWHIKKLEVFDKPMILSEFYKDYDTMDTDSNGKCIGWYEIGINPIKHHPKSWQYVWVKE